MKLEMGDKLVWGCIVIKHPTKREIKNITQKILSKRVVVLGGKK